jgi:GNAT superfamily N-acetyltransferase
VEGKIDIFAHYGVNCVLEHMFLATMTEFYGRGIGRRLVQVTEEVANALARGEDVIAPLQENTNSLKSRSVPRVQAVMAIFTSTISQKIGSSLGWEKLAVVNHDEMFFEGKPYSFRIGPDHPTSMLMGKKIVV